jgi:pyridoxine 4-dehydrogenase
MFLLGGTLPVHGLALGTFRLVGPGGFGPPPDREEGRRVLRRAVELGANLIDTADTYGPGYAEELIAEALAPYPDSLVIATKGGSVISAAGEIQANGTPAHLSAACDASRVRLHLDRIPWGA